MQSKDYVYKLLILFFLIMADEGEIVKKIESIEKKVSAPQDPKLIALAFPILIGAIVVCGIIVGVTIWFMIAFTYNDSDWWWLLLPLILSAVFIVLVILILVYGGMIDAKVKIFLALVFMVGSAISLVGVILFDAYLLGEFLELLSPITTGVTDFIGSLIPSGEGGEGGGGEGQSFIPEGFSIDSIINSTIGPLLEYVTGFISQFNQSGGLGALTDLMNPPSVQ